MASPSALFPASACSPPISAAPTVTCRAEAAHAEQAPPTTRRRHLGPQAPLIHGRRPEVRAHAPLAAASRPRPRR